MFKVVEPVKVRVGIDLSEEAVEHCKTVTAVMVLMEEDMKVFMGKDSEEFDTKV